MSKAEARKDAEAWHHVAVVRGYNELAKEAKTLGEKVYFRLARDHAEGEAAKAGVKINRVDQGNVILEMTTAPPFITFHERDIEFMRAAVAAFDKARAPECTGTSASWCPVCGDCKCPDNDYGERTLDDESCPLHSRQSKHAELPAPPPTGATP